MNRAHLPVAPPPQKHWVWPDVFRGLAALAVCAGHLRAALFVDLGQAPSAGLASKLFYAATGLGHQAVMIFFVLSGFLVGGAVMRQREAFSAGDYLSSRLSRLWTVLLPALAITLLADLILMQTAPSVLDGTLRDTWGSTPIGDAHTIGLAALLGNIFFLQTLVTPVYGSNGPLWSLAYEFWYYLAFPALVFACLRDGMRSAVATVAFLLWVLLMPAPVLAGFVIWLQGVGVWWLARRPSSWLASPVAATLLTLAFMAALGLSRVLPARFTGDVADQVVGLAFALWLASLLQQRWQPSLSSRWGQPLRWLSDISFSLYATHFPLVLLLGVAWETQAQQWTFGTPSALGFGLGLALLLLSGWLVWWLTERHTGLVRNRMKLLLKPVRWHWLAAKERRQ